MIQTRTHTVFDIENAFKDFLNSHNHPIEKTLRFDTVEFNRYACPHASNRSNQDVRYKIFSDGVPSGYIKCWHCGIEADFCFKKQHEVSPEEWSKHKEQLAKRKREDEAYIRKLHSNAGKEAQRMWSNAASCIKHDYLENKHVQSYGLRVQTDGTLLIPCFNEKLELVNLERIYFDKQANKFQKRPLKGGQRIGAFYLIGEVTDQQGTIYISEGYSTAATVYESTSCPSAASFNCGNLPHVAKVIRKLYPEANIVIAADLDLNEAGKKHAKKAVSLVGGSVCLPDFTSLNLSAAEIQQEKLSDFNDLYAELLRKGFSKEAALGEVQLQLKSGNISMIADHKEKFSGKHHANDEMNGKENQLPKNFKFTKDGLVYEKRNREGEVEQEINVSSRIEVIAKQCDLYTGGNTGLTLAFTNIFDKYQQWAMPRSLLGDGEKGIVNTLCGQGATILDKKRFLDYLMQSNPSKSLFCVDRIGWHRINGNPVFVFPNNKTIGYSSDKEKIIFQSEKLDTPFKTRGNSEEWREKIGKYCSGNSRLIFGVSHGLASMLLFITNNTNGGINFFGESSTGKTTIAQVCTSLFGEPAYLSACRTTTNALEKLAHSRHDCLLVLDELAQMNAEDLGDAIYTLGNGAGKERMTTSGELRQRLTFRCNFLFTGEIPVSQRINEGGKRETEGQLVRVLDIPAVVGKGVFDRLPEEFSSGRDFSNYLKEQCAQYYGSAAMSFLEKMIVPENLDLIPDLIKSIRLQLVEDLLDGAHGQAERALDRFALGACAGELATRWGLTGWEEGEAIAAAKTCLKAWLTERGGVENQESVKILKQVRAFFLQHGESRFTDISQGKHSEDSKTINRAGFKELVGGVWMYYVPAEAFKEIHKGFNKNLTIKSLIDVGWLETTTNANGQIEACKQKKIPGLGKNGRFYTFNELMWE